MMKAATPPLYTDEKVILATGLPLDALRRLITWGAVRPAQSGGGRGRVRLWTTRQALRISATTQFAAAGFSLQMAHTLTYCLPLDSLVTLYDPFMMTSAVDKKHHKNLTHLFGLLTKEQTPEEWQWPTPGHHHGSQTLIVDSRFLYTDAYDRIPRLIGQIDPIKQRVIPYADPTQRRIFNAALEKSSIADVSMIDKDSLLIDNKYLASTKVKKEMDNDWSAPTEIAGKALCRSLLSINLALGFVLCVRALRGLPSEYYAFEIEPEVDRA